MSGLVTNATADNFQSLLNGLGKIPVLGTVSGACRIGYGVAASVLYGFVSACYDAKRKIGKKKKIEFNQAISLNEARAKVRTILALMHLGRGFVELFSPIGSGLLLNQYDKETVGERLWFRAAGRI